MRVYCVCMNKYFSDNSGIALVSIVLGVVVVLSLALGGWLVFNVGFNGGDGGSGTPFSDRVASGTPDGGLLIGIPRGGIQGTVVQGTVIQGTVVQNMEICIESDGREFCTTRQLVCFTDETDEECRERNLARLEVRTIDGKQFMCFTDETDAECVARHTAQSEYRAIEVCVGEGEERVCTTQQLLCHKDETDAECLARHRLESQFEVRTIDGKQYVCFVNETDAECVARHTAQSEYRSIEVCVGEGEERVCTTQQLLCHKDETDAECLTRHRFESQFEVRTIDGKQYVCFVNETDAECVARHAPDSTPSGSEGGSNPFDQTAVPADFPGIVFPSGDGQPPLDFGDPQYSAGDGPNFNFEEGSYEEDDFVKNALKGLAFSTIGPMAACVTAGLAANLVATTSVANLDGPNIFKECFSDIDINNWAKEIAADIANEYINFAMDGFNGRPLFISHPNQFWKDFTDRAIGDALEREGLGFLCDIDGVEIDISNILSIQYTRPQIQRPRCTLSDFKNNLREFAENPFDINISGAVNISSGSVPRTRPRESINREVQNLINQTTKLFGHYVAETGGSLGMQRHIQQRRVDEIAREIGEQTPGSTNLAEDDTLAAFDCTDEVKEVGETDSAEARINLLRCRINQTAQNINNRAEKFIDLQIEPVTEADEMGEVFQKVVDATVGGLIKKSITEGRGKAYGRGSVLVRSISGDEYRPTGTRDEQPRPSRTKFQDDNPNQNPTPNQTGQAALFLGSYRESRNILMSEKEKIEQEQENIRAQIEQSRIDRRTEEDEDIHEEYTNRIQRLEQELNNLNLVHSQVENILSDVCAQIREAGEECASES